MLDLYKKLLESTKWRKRTLLINFIASLGGSVSKDPDLLGKKFQIRIPGISLFNSNIVTSGKKCRIRSKCFRSTELKNTNPYKGVV